MTDLAETFGTYDALGLADLVRRKEVTPSELVEIAIERIERVNPALNCVILKTYDLARELARGPLPEGPFTGVPFLMKDLLTMYAGLRTTGACRFLKDFTATEDSVVVRRMKRAGLILVGKTNTPELGSSGSTEPVMYGPTRNPWNVEHIPGGSSGGSAAAVAARIVPLADGSDGGRFDSRARIQQWTGGAQAQPRAGAPGSPLRGFLVRHGGSQRSDTHRTRHGRLSGCHLGPCAR